MSWDEATKIWAEQTGPDDGFYLSLQVRFFVSWITLRVVFQGLTKYTMSSEKLAVHINYCSVLQNAFSLALKLISSLLPTLSIKCYFIATQEIF